MIKRIFHPVGQGAFYSERHELPDSTVVNIVYDCGSHGSVKELKDVVTQSFTKNDVIDILFISHFHKDHVSLIKTLQHTVKGIKRVVLPLLHKEQKIFLYNIHTALNQKKLANLIANPERYFGGETQIIKVLPASERTEPTDPIIISNIDSSSTIPSNTPIILSRDYQWVFIPANHEYRDRSEQFTKKLCEEGIYTPDNINSILSTKIKSKIRNIYKEIEGGINENSMFLYSGPPEELHRYFHRQMITQCGHCFYCPFYHHNLIHRVACLYTGDGKLSEAWSAYKKYWNSIGTIQIPHHGSKDSYDGKVLFLYGVTFLCPISVGKNSYGHPHKSVINDIQSHGSLPILITEDPLSIYTETIIT